jgi:restriction system protein
MAVPDFQSVMLPLLKVLGDGEEHSLHEVVSTLADQFDLTDEERRELLPSGRQAKLANRSRLGQDLHEEGGPFGEHRQGKVPDKRSRPFSLER